MVPGYPGFIFQGIDVVPIRAPYRIRCDHFKEVPTTLKTGLSEKGHLHSELSHFGTFNINLGTQAYLHFCGTVEWGQGPGMLAAF